MKRDKRQFGQRGDAVALLQCTVKTPWSPLIYLHLPKSRVSDPLRSTEVYTERCGPETFDLRRFELIPQKNNVKSDFPLGINLHISLPPSTSI